MKHHQFTFEFNDYKEVFPEWDEWNMADTELDVTYNVINGRVHVCSVKMRADSPTGYNTAEIRHILAALDGLKTIKRACENDCERRNQAQIRASYPKLHPTTEEIIDMLKLK